MNKPEFLNIMQFPALWLELKMYPDILFAAQLEAYTPGGEESSEHYRNGAFHWWLNLEPSEAQLASLVSLSHADPDTLMAKDVQSHIRKAAAFSPHIEAALNAGT